MTTNYGGARGAAHSLVLNYLTAPRVLIWSAVAASCALPGLMRSVTLMAKDFAGHTVPFHAVGSVQTIDGSMASDIPASEMALMFHCNRTIVSQTNPHIVPFMRDTGPRAYIDSNPLSRMLSAIQTWATLDISMRSSYLAHMRLLPKFFGAELSSVLTQRYSGDVTIVPHQPMLSQWRALSQPSEQDMANYIRAGERATWPHLAHIRTLVLIEKKLSACAHRFAHAEAALPRALTLKGTSLTRGSSSGTGGSAQVVAQALANMHATAAASRASTTSAASPAHARLWPASRAVNGVAGAVQADTGSSGGSGGGSEAHTSPYAAHAPQEQQTSFLPPPVLRRDAGAAVGTGRDAFPDADLELSDADTASRQEAALILASGGVRLPSLAPGRAASA
ncbi:hypothetical protein EON68_03650, partial [archaeon]